MSRTLEETLKVYVLGDHLTDVEVVELSRLYHDVSVATVVFGQRYELVFLDAIRQENKLNDMIRARGITSFTDLRERKKS